MAYADQALRALGGDEPSWRRLWKSEQDFIDAGIPPDAVEGALLELVERRGAEIKLLHSPSGNRFLLERISTLPGSVGRFLIEERPVAAARDPEHHPCPQQTRTSAPVDGSAERGPPPAKVPPRASADSGTNKDEVRNISSVLSGLGFRILQVSPTVERGPTITRFRIELHPRQGVGALRRRAEDIGRQLRCPSVPLVTSLKGEGFVALDIPCERPQVLPLAPALDALPPVASGALWIPAGQLPSGERIVLDLVDAPHVLAAGATNSGKTSWLLTAILSLVLRIDSRDLELLVLDPKALDLGLLDGLPHLRSGKVITDASDGVEALFQLVAAEVPARTRMLQEAGYSNLREWRRNRLGKEMKFMVVVIDEFAELTVSLSRQKRAALEIAVLRLAQRARAVGIHLALATQRPTVGFIAGAIKANLPVRISFRLPQRVDSLAILDEPGAERLLGAGDMLLSRNGNIQRLQAYYATPKQLSALVRARIESLQGGTA